MDIRFVKRDVLKEKPDQKHLGFGKYMTDYMFVMDWTKEDGWKDARIAVSYTHLVSPTKALGMFHDVRYHVPLSDHGRCQGLLSGLQGGL